MSSVSFSSYVHTFVDYVRGRDHNFSLLLNVKLCFIKDTCIYTHVYIKNIVYIKDLPHMNSQTHQSKLS